MNQYSAQERKNILKEINSGLSQEELAHKYGISRITLYNWQKQLQEKNSLEKNHKKGADHYKSLSENTSASILDLVIKNPTASVPQLANLLIKQNIIVGTHGIQRILERYNLSKSVDRLIYASKFASNQTEEKPRIEYDPSFVQSQQFTPQKIPAPPLVRPVFQEKVTFSSRIKKILVFASASFLFALVLFFSTFFITQRILTSGNIIQASGILFATVALLFGSFFFVYSVRYYLITALLLVFSRNSQKESARGNNSEKAKSLGMFSDVTSVKLTHQPFVSLHLPLFNEKTVVNRLLEAATSIDYDNYEIIVCDDSTDETTNIINEWRNHPKIKISHRENRHGFKGGALSKGLEIMNPATQFVIVLDSDFLPFPDTITQFLKYFQISVGSIDEKIYKSTNTAAIQGYQWHVLNKSENWVTSGIRSEYAGSYVVERSSSEIYKGLKQIAGSVFMIRADILRGYGWSSSITEDFELTLRLYRDGFKVLYTPYIQAPSECVSALDRLVRQRMRWAEGHSYNVKRMFSSVLSSRLTTLAEKLDFVYLAPYYLQSFFFLLGTFAWFISEAVLHVHLPFWTALWGWSLVITNFLSLPLMNSVGLFLEESQEKDFAGIPAFILLSYILAPFQAYASVKGFLEKEEGPWFRTPKTGKITDVFVRGRFYHWVRVVFGQVQIKSTFSGFSFLRTKAFAMVGRGESVFSPRPKFSPYHKRKRSRVWIASLLLATILLNYASFFRPQPALAASPGFEQQINIVDQTATTTSSTDGPVDNSLGLVLWTAGSYTGATVYFEAVLKTSNSAQTVTATLYDSAGVAVSGSAVSLTGAGSTNNTRKRSNSISLTDGSAYTVEFNVTGGATGSLGIARLIVVQTHATQISGTEMQAELGYAGTSSSANYSRPTQHPIFKYESGNFSPTPTAYFEATLNNTTAGQTAFAALYTDGSSCSTVVSGSEVSTVGTTWSRVRSSSITLTNGTEYMVCIKDSANTVQLANAKIVFVQSDNTNGISATEMVHTMQALSATTTSSTYASTNEFIQFTPGSFTGGTFAYYFDATVYVSQGAATAFAQLFNKTDSSAITSSEVSTTSTTVVRLRSSDLSANMPASTKDLDTQLKNSTGGAGNSTRAPISNLIITVSSLTVPEHSLLFLPFVLFIPFVLDTKRRTKILARLSFLNWSSKLSTRETKKDLSNKEGKRLNDS